MVTTIITILEQVIAYVPSLFLILLWSFFAQQPKWTFQEGKPDLVTPLSPQLQWSSIVTRIEF